jgi:hypothetical protein
VTSRFARAERSLHRDAGPDVIAMVAGGRDLHVLSGPAAVIWRILAEPGELDEVTDQVARIYGRSSDEVREPVEACVRTLIGRGLAEERP